jgi:hypothetical protein
VERNCASDSSNPVAAQGIVETTERLGARGSGLAANRSLPFKAAARESRLLESRSKPYVGQNLTSEAESTVEAILA